jgi:hypothetical protein
VREAGNGDYIKLDRKILQWGWYTDVNTCKLFIHCLLKANWKPGVFHGVTCERGQFITSLHSLSKETGLSVKAVRTALSHLNETNEVASRSTSKFTVITVINYDLYQSKGKVSGKQRANEGQSKGKQRATIEEYNKESKEGKESGCAADCPSGTHREIDPDDYVANFYANR